MKNNNQKYYLLNFVFVTGLMVLVINDHVLKLVFSNWITGKLSDFSGLLIFPMLLAFLFPKFLKMNTILTGVFFVFWKSPFSEAFINAYNQYIPIQLHRVVDYSDLIALSILPVSYYFLTNMDKFGKLKIQSKRLSPVFVLIPAVLAFLATSPPYYYRYTFSDGELTCFKCTTTVKYSKNELLEILKTNNYNVSVDTLPTQSGGYRFNSYWKDSLNTLTEDYPYYKIDTLIIEKDTITDLQFALEVVAEDKTKVWINGMNISEDIPDQSVPRELRKYYRKLLKNYLKETVSKK